MGGTGSKAKLWGLGESRCNGKSMHKLHGLFCVVDYLALGPNGERRRNWRSWLSSSSCCRFSSSCRRSPSRRPWNWSALSCLIGSQLLGLKFIVIIIIIIRIPVRSTKDSLRARLVADGVSGCGGRNHHQTGRSQWQICIN